MSGPLCGCYRTNACETKHTVRFLLPRTALFDSLDGTSIWGTLLYDRDGVYSDSVGCELGLRLCSSHGNSVVFQIIFGTRIPEYGAAIATEGDLH